jgi:catechol 2,3-dioxygenase-like lactoylglutathione lyase family enzyme
MSHARRFDHVGITVADLDKVTAFFVGLGLEIKGRTFVEGEFLDTVSGIPTPAPRSSCSGHPTEVPG